VKTVRDLLVYEIYPGLFQHLEAALPEFGFRRSGQAWRATQGPSLSGEPDKADGHVYVYADNPSRLIDHRTGNHLSIWDYLAQRDGLSPADTLRTLARLAQTQLPVLDLSPEEQLRLSQARRRADLWETANAYLIERFHTDRSPVAQAHRDYCRRRGYTLSDLRTPGQALHAHPSDRKDSARMELGFLPSPDALRQHLLSQGFTPEELAQHLRLGNAIGQSHQLTIPVRDALGRIRGLVARNIAHNAAHPLPKYLYTQGLERNKLLFNLRVLQPGVYGPDLVLVEGQLDALLATARGMTNVVALGGSSLSAAQLDEALRAGARRMTLCLDADAAGHAATLRIVRQLIGRQEVRTYVARLPEGVKDPDQCIQQEGVEAFRLAVDQALTAGWWLGRQLIEPIEVRPGGELSPKERDDLLAQLVDYSLQCAHLQDQADIRHVVFKFLHRAQMSRLTDEDVDRAIAHARAQRADVQRRKALESLLREAQQLTAADNAPAALDLLRAETPRLRAAAASHILQPYPFSQFLDEVALTPDGLRTGILSLDRLCRLPQGAITIVAGRPSHGKTTLLLNLIMGLVDQYPDRQFVFLSYEEERKRLLLKLLNYLTQVPMLDPERTNLAYLHDYIRRQATNHPAIEHAKDRLRELLDSQRIIILDQALDAYQLADTCRYLADRHNLGAFFIDYIQKIRITERLPTRQVELQRISDIILQDIAKATGLPVVLGAQLNRDAQTEDLKLHQLREAGDIEQDANLVLGLWNAATAGAEAGGESVAYDPVVDLKVMVMKNREGLVNVQTTLDFYRQQHRIVDRQTLRGSYPANPKAKSLGDNMPLAPTNGGTEATW